MFAADFIGQSWLRTIIELNRLGSEAQRRNRRLRKFYRIPYLYMAQKQASKQALLYLCQCQQYRWNLIHERSWRENGNAYAYIIDVLRQNVSWRLWNIRDVKNAVAFDASTYFDRLDRSRFIAAARLRVIRLWRNKNARIDRMKPTGIARGSTVALWIYWVVRRADRAWKTHRRAIKAAIHPKARCAKRRGQRDCIPRQLLSPSRARELHWSHISWYHVRHFYGK